MPERANAEIGWSAAISAAMAAVAVFSGTYGVQIGSIAITISATLCLIASLVFYIKANKKTLMIEEIPIAPSKMNSVDEIVSIIWKEFNEYDCERIERSIGILRKNSKETWFINKDGNINVNLLIDHAQSERRRELINLANGFEETVSRLIEDLARSTETMMASVNNLHPDPQPKTDEIVAKENNEAQSLAGFAMEFSESLANLARDINRVEYSGVNQIDDSEKNDFPITVSDADSIRKPIEMVIPIRENKLHLTLVYSSRGIDNVLEWGGKKSGKFKIKIERFRISTKIAS